MFIASASDVQEPCFLVQQLCHTFLHRVNKLLSLTLPPSLSHSPSLSISLTLSLFISLYLCSLSNARILFSSHKHSHNHTLTHVHTQTCTYIYIQIFSLPITYPAFFPFSHHLLLVIPVFI